MGIFSFMNKHQLNKESKKFDSYNNNDNDINNNDINNNKNIAEGFEYRQPEIFGVKLNDWKSSVETAWDENNPNRIELADIYKAMTSYDSQVMTAIQQRKLSTLQGEINIYNEDGTVNDELNKIIKSPSGATKKFIKNFMSYALDAIFWGFELVIVDIKNGDVVVRKIPERNVIPNEKVILRDTLNNMGDKIPFDSGRLGLISCKLSYTDDLNDLGLLNGCAPYFFSKVTGSWKAHADKFGMLTRVLKTSSENKAKMLASYNMLKNQVRGNFMILGEDDELTFEGDSRNNIKIYEDLNNYCDSSISKIILGQTSTTDQKSYAGSAEVHQDVLSSIIKSDREYVESVVNDQLFPILMKLGVLPQTKVYFGLAGFENTNLNERADIIKKLYDAGFNVSKEQIASEFNLDII